MEDDDGWSSGKKKGVSSEEQDDNVRTGSEADTEDDSVRTGPPKPTPNFGCKRRGRWRIWKGRRRGGATGAGTVPREDDLNAHDLNAHAGCTTCQTYWHCVAESKAG